MSWQWIVPSVSLFYLGLLFAIAYYADQQADRGNSLIANPYIYTLSIAVYCTSWTYYGSVGRAAITGIGFLPIYIGPTLMAVSWWFLLRKIVRISKTNRIISIADFIASRYGKNRVIGGLVTLIAVIGIMPYISLQLKAIATSLEVLIHHLDSGFSTNNSPATWDGTAFYVALILALFSILFGTRHLDATERHEGMVAAIAFESLIKLSGFLAVGIFVTYNMFDGPGDIFSRALADPNLKTLLTFDALPGGYASWFSLTFLSMMAILFLPRQFQVLVVENVNESHIKKASWLFPLYLFIINIFVLPIAFAGRLTFADGAINPDTFILTLPIFGNQEWLALFVYVGGLSAATSMVIVAAITLSTMVCNDLIIPVFLRLRSTEQEDLSGLILTIRRGAIIGIIMLGYLYFWLIGESHTLVTIGLISFAAAAQFAPAILLGIYWKGASRRGAMAGLIIGFIIWAHTLLLSSFAESGWVDYSFITDGPWGMAILRPYALFGLDSFDHITHSIFWSMFFNIGTLLVISLFDRQTAIERIQALNFVNVFEKGAEGGDAYLWSGSVTVGNLRRLVSRFIGPIPAQRAFADQLNRSQLHLDDYAMAPPSLVAFGEQTLTGAIGAASARVMVSSVVTGEELDLEGVMRILDETTHVIEYSQRLEQKSEELEAATLQLQQANDRLKELDRLKDEFISIVSHELRTPLTSIRAFSEIIFDNEDLELTERKKFLGIIIKETERLTRLVNQVLDLAKIESGRVEWNLTTVDLREITQEAVDATSQIFENEQIKLENFLPNHAIPIYADRDRMLQVIINLLSNAYKFCNQDNGLVQIHLRQTDEEAGLEVLDNGIGIRPVERLQIFDKFHQVRQDSREDKPKGTGLGLTICQRIIEHHGGRIWVEGKPGHGAIFVFALPHRHRQNTDLGNAPE
ncbi:MAG: histidine kinase [Magnetococcales bacterium]|nr:histidine kinase [Magnetococcales bacterium]